LDAGAATTMPKIRMGEVEIVGVFVEALTNDISWAR